MALVAPCPPVVGSGGHRPSLRGLLSDVATRSSFAAGGSASRARKKGAVATPIPRAVASNWSADGWLPPFPAFSSGPSGGRTYRRMDSCLVIPPPAGRKPLAIIKFLGGAFVGATPEVTYSHLMELLAKEGFLVVSVPYEVTFDHSRAARQVYERFHACMEGILDSGIPGADLRAEDLVGLPVYSVGHSNGALLQVLVGCYFSEKIPQANVIISFNNRPASEAVPYFEQLGPLVSQAVPLMEASPMYSMAQNASDAWKAFLDTAGTLVQGYDQEAAASLNKFVNQLPSVMNEVTQGISEFKPTPSENRDLCNKTYNVPQTLLVKFNNDAIDETDALEEVLRPRVESIGGTLEKVSLSGNHLTPCVQLFVLLETPDAGRWSSTAPYPQSSVRFGDSGRWMPPATPSPDRSLLRNTSKPASRSHRRAQEHVRLDLSENNFTGEIPASLVRLTNFWMPPATPSPDRSLLRNTSKACFP